MICMHLLKIAAMVSFVVAIVFGVQVNDRYWLPRPDQNYLSWGFGFLIISAIFTCVSGVCLFKEGWRAYEELLIKEDEYTKAVLEMAAVPMMELYPPTYDDGPGYGPSGPEYGPPPTAMYPPPAPAYQPSGTYGYDASYGPSSSSHPSYEKEPRYDRPQERSFEKVPLGPGYEMQPSQSYDRPSHPQSLDPKPLQQPQGGYDKSFESKEPARYEKSYERRYSDASDEED